MDSPQISNYTQMFIKGSLTPQTNILDPFSLQENIIDPQNTSMSFGEIVSINNEDQSSLSSTLTDSPNSATISTNALENETILSDDFSSDNQDHYIEETNDNIAIYNPHIYLETTSQHYFTDDITSPHQQLYQDNIIPSDILKHTQINDKSTLDIQNENIQDASNTLNELEPNHDLVFHTLHSNTNQITLNAPTVLGKTNTVNHIQPTPINSKNSAIDKLSSTAHLDSHIEEEINISNKEDISMMMPIDNDIDSTDQGNILHSQISLSNNEKYSYTNLSVESSKISKQASLAKNVLSPTDVFQPKRQSVFDQSTNLHFTSMHLYSAEDTFESSPQHNFSLPKFIETQEPMSPQSQQIFLQISQAESGKSQNFHVQLVPSDEFGIVNVNISFPESGQASIVLSSQDENALEILKSDAHLLEQNIIKGEFDNVDISFSLSDDSQQQSFSHNQQHNHQSQHNNYPEQHFISSNGEYPEEKLYPPPPTVQIEGSTLHIGKYNKSINILA